MLGRRSLLAAALVSASVQNGLASPDIFAETHYGKVRGAVDTDKDGIPRAYDAQVDAKTTLVLRVDRSINTYYLNLGSEVDTDAGFTVAWQARYNLNLSLGYTFTYRDFPGPVAARQRAPVSWRKSPGSASARMVPSRLPASSSCVMAAMTGP